MTDKLNPNPKKYTTFIAVSGGILTAVALISLLNWFSQYLKTQKPIASPPPQTTQPKTPTENPSPTSIDTQLKAKAEKIAILDSQSVEFPGDKVGLTEIMAIKTPYIPETSELQPFESKELDIARQAWAYFEHNWHEETGLVNSANDFPSVTLWDQTAALAAVVSAYELGIIPQDEFNNKIKTSLETIKNLALYKQELPNKVYNAKTLIPVNYGQLDKQEEIGWSAIDLGRLALWLKIIGNKYPQFRVATTAIWESWNLERLVKNGQLYGTSVVNGKETYNQEGRLGYENYAAYGFKLWGLEVEKALDYENKSVFVNLYNVGIPYDVRDYHNSEANNYVLSEPYFLDGIETGFQSLPKAYADRILKAQENRYQVTKQLTALTEDNLDREPYFVYNTLFVNGKPWSTITDTRENHNNLRFLSTKAAIGWHVIYNTEYTKQLTKFVRENLASEKGWYNGFYEYDQKPNQSLTANNNGIILESMLYLKVRKPLLVWAGVK
ncbi:MAG: DUF3131 domain-containing protein [Chloroflexi bacterium AL-N10]|nr:DUF3131 domain-containing protein [Chloroflexi bacterium AL-N10]NOK92774.1 DUF3131 domain-containing protein [Chloroflexi bacterium AL-N15]